MQRKDDSSKTRRDRGLELPAVEEVPVRRSVPMENVSRDRGAGAVTPGRVREPPPPSRPAAARPSTSV